MSAAAKFHISRIVVLVTIPVMGFCFSHMIPAGLHGNTPVVVRWFIVLAITAVTGITSYVVMTFSKSRMSDPAGELSEAEILAAAEADITRQKQATAQPTTANSKLPARKDVS
jgi:hypothetical protein